MSFSSYQIFIGAIYSFKCFLSKFVGWEDIFEPFLLLNLLNIVYCDLLRISFFFNIINSSILEKNDNLIRSKFFVDSLMELFGGGKECDFNLKYISLSCSD